MFRSNIGFERGGRRGRPPSTSSTSSPRGRRTIRRTSPRKARPRRARLRRATPRTTTPRRASLMMRKKSQWSNCKRPKPK